MDVQHERRSESIFAAQSRMIQKITRQARALWGTTRSRINNMVEGVTKGFDKEAQNRRCWLECKSTRINNRFEYWVLPHCGSSQHQMVLLLRLKKALQVTITGADKQAVGQFAASDSLESVSQSHITARASCTTMKS